MPPRIGLQLLGHPDYPNPLGHAYTESLRSCLAGSGVDVVWDERPWITPLPAAQAARALAKQDVEGVIFVLGTWLECSTALAAIRELEHLPFALAAFPMYETAGQRESTGSFVAACALQPALRRMGYRHKLVVGAADDPETGSQLLDFGWAAHATERLKRQRLGLVGYSAMAIYPGTFDHVLLRRLVGPEVVHLDTYTLLRRAEKVAPEAVEANCALVREHCQVEVATERLQKAARLAAAARVLAQEHHLDAMNVKCQYELSQEFGMTACVPMALLAEEGVVASCEGDVMVTVSQMLLQLLTGRQTTYGDLLDLRGPRALVSSCGFAPFGCACAQEARHIRELDYPGFDGIICSFTLHRGPVTLVRLAEGRGDFHLVYAEGLGVETALRQGRFPALEVELSGDPRRLMEVIPSQHFALCAGHHAARLEDACRILGIEAVAV